MAYLEAFLSYIDIKTTLAFVAVFLLLSNVFRQRINLPPGPMCLPLLGSLPSLAFNILRSGDTPEVMLTKMAKTYGDVFSLKVGTKVVVVCNGYNSIKEAFQNPIMNDRPKSYMMEELSIHEGKSLHQCSVLFETRGLRIQSAPECVYIMHRLTIIMIIPFDGFNFFLYCLNYVLDSRLNFAFYFFVPFSVCMHVPFSSL